MTWALKMAVVNEIMAVVVDGKMVVWLRVIRL